jgi:hypothetical protein
VLKAIDSVGDPIERANAVHALLRIAMASLQIGMGLSNTGAKKKNVNAVLAALTAKRTTSNDIDHAIAALAAPLAIKHPTWRAARVANEIADVLNKQLGAQGLPSLGPDAIRKRVQKHRRTNGRSSNKKRTNVGPSS